MDILYGLPAGNISSRQCAWVCFSTEGEPKHGHQKTYRVLTLRASFIRSGGGGRGRSKQRRRGENNKVKGGKVCFTWKGVLYVAPLNRCSSLLSTFSLTRAQRGGQWEQERLFLTLTSLCIINELGVTSSVNTHPCDNTRTQRNRLFPLTCTRTQNNPCRHH